MADPQKSPKAQDKPALPRQWIVPLRLLVYAVLAGCAAYVYFNYQDMKWSEILILMPIVMVAAMLALDCKMSDAYWQAQDKTNNSSSNQ